MKYKNPIALIFAWFVYPSAAALGHDVSQHVDPDLLAGWLTWAHLTIQWTHLTAFGLWLGLTAGILILGAKTSLDQLLYPSWILVLIILATGNYNIEYSTGISETPSLLSLPLLDKIPYGVTYTIILAAKLGLYVLVVLITLIITVLHVWTRLDKSNLRKTFLISQSGIAILIALVTAKVLFYHEVADLWPTPIHSLGGVAGPEGPRGQTALNQNTPPPNDFRLLTTTAAWFDIATRWVHLLGFGLWFGASAAALLFSPVSAARFLSVSWLALLFQISSGVISMDRWTPFYVAPYFWNLDKLFHIRFGRSYTLFMTAKHILVSAIAVLMIIWTVRYLRLWRKDRGLQLSIRSLAGANFLIGLVIGYIMIILLFLHEGVDHAL